MRQRRVMSARQRQLAKALSRTQQQKIRKLAAAQQACKVFRQPVESTQKK